MKNRLKEYRTQAKMTQQQLANEVHVTTRTIISLEKGTYNPSILLAYKISLVFHTTIEALFCLEQAKKSEDTKYENL